MGAEPVSWRLEARDGPARRGVLTTPHGPVATPGFMPVGTRGTVKGIDSQDLTSLGAEMILANTYHLMLRPGADVVAELGELHGFTGWDGPILTDSGGFQVFSLDPAVDEDGVTFKSVYDGATIHLTPEDATAVQETLGSDIAMTLDVLIPLPAEREVAEAAMDRTLRWAKRAQAAKTRGDRALFGIVQGGVDPDLRARSASATAALGFPGFGIGGLSVGESPEQRNRALDAAVPELPDDSPRYVMGLGDTEGILDAVSRGVDLFDCVLPTRLARHGKVLHPDGDFSIGRAEWTTSAEPIDPDCGCPTCCNHSRAYLRHLFAVKEFVGPRLLTLHNLQYTFDLMSGIREAVGAGSFSAYAHERIARRRAGTNEDPASSH